MSRHSEMDSQKQLHSQLADVFNVTFCITLNVTFSMQNNVHGIMLPILK